MGLQPNSTTGGAANSSAFVQKLLDLLKPRNDAFGQAKLCFYAAGTQ